MNWQAISYDWAQVRAFLATAEEGSLSAAARVLGLTQPTLGRQVAALEETLGVTLFERSGRNWRLTQAGRDLLKPAAEMREAALRFSLNATGQAQAVAGPVTITTTDVIATYVLPPILAELRRIAPGIEPHIDASNQVQDLTRREADISIRHARPTQQDLIGKLVGEREAFLYATPAYLDRVGRPETLHDINHMDFIGFDDAAKMIPVIQSFGLPLEAEAIRLSSTSGPVIAQMAKAGLGITVLTDDMAHRTGGLERILPEAFSVPIPVWLVTHSELHTSRRIRLVFDLLADHLSRLGALDGW